MGEFVRRNVTDVPQKVITISIPSLLPDGGKTPIILFKCKNYKLCLGR